MKDGAPFCGGSSLLYKPVLRETVQTDPGILEKINGTMIGNDFFGSTNVRQGGRPHVYANMRSKCRYMASPTKYQKKGLRTGLEIFMSIFKSYQLKSLAFQFVALFTGSE